MKKLLIMIALFAVVATSSFAHNVHAQTKMGTVKMIHGDDLTLTMSDGDLEKVELSNTTSYTHADNRAATRRELAVGIRVVVKMSADGKTVASVKMSAAPKKK